MIAIIFVTLAAVALLGVYGIEKKDYAIALMAILCLGMFVVGCNL